MRILDGFVPGGSTSTTLEAGNSVMWNRGCCHNRVVTSRFKILLPLVKVSENENRWKSGWWSSPRLARQIVHEGKDNRALLQLDLWIKDLGFEVTISYSRGSFSGAASEFSLTLTLNWTCQYFAYSKFTISQLAPFALHSRLVCGQLGQTRPNL